MIRNGTLSSTLHESKFVHQSASLSWAKRRIFS